MSQKQAEIIALFQQVAQQVDKRPFDHIKPESVIAELGIDSLAMMQIVGEMELKLDIMIPDEDLVELTTIADLIRVVEKRLA